MKRNILKNRKFSTKLIITCLILLLIPIFLISILQYIFLRRSLLEKTDDYLKNLSAVTMSKVEMSVNSIEDISFYIAGNLTIQKIMKLENESLNTKKEQLDIYYEIRRVLSYYTMLREEIISVSIFSNDGEVYRYSKNKLYQYDEKIFELSGDNENTWLFYDGKILLIHPINLFPSRELVGKIVMEIDDSVFYDIIKDIEYVGGSAVIIGQQNRIVSNKDSSMVGERLSKDYNKIQGIENKIISGVKIEEKKYVVCISKPITNGWKMVLSIPSSYFEKNLRTMKKWNTMIVLIIGSLSILLIILMSRSITRPLKELSRAMEAVGQGEFNTNYIVNGEDEIALLGKTFNQMVVDMRNLISTVYEQRMLKQNAEIKSLQMQINPHFLYNTLETINWLARLQGIDEVGDLTVALSSLMRYSLSKKEFVTIEEEINNLKDYVEIQNVRYGDKVTIEFQIEEESKHCCIPKLLIQPILENAIIHGAEEKIGSCQIQVRVYTQEEELFVVVEDNGVGMTQSAMEKILEVGSEQIKKEHTSIGLMNVNKRIQMVFGESYGIQIRSILGEGTCVVLRMKKSPNRKIEI